WAWRIVDAVVERVAVCVMRSGRSGAFRCAMAWGRNAVTTSACLLRDRADQLAGHTRSAATTFTAHAHRYAPTPPHPGTSGGPRGSARRVAGRSVAHAGPCGAEVSL